MLNESTQASAKVKQVASFQSKSYQNVMTRTKLAPVNDFTLDVEVLVKLTKVDLSAAATSALDKRGDLLMGLRPHVVTARSRGVVV